MKKILVVLTVLAALKSGAQQDPQYSLYQFNQMAINPGYAGARDAIAIVADLRKQWAGIEGSPMTSALTVHSPIMNDKLGVGINFVNDRLGAKAVNGFYGNVAYILKLTNQMKLSFGARVGYAMYKFNFSEVKFKDGNEVALNDLNSTNKGALDIDAGLFLRGNSYFVGLSATHLSNSVVYQGNFQGISSLGSPTDYSLTYALKTHIFLTAGKSFAISENFLIAPSVMVKTVGGNTSADINLNTFLYKRFWLGIYVRQGYGYGALFQAYITNQLRIGYSFDTGAGDQSRLGGGHEIMIGFDIKRPKAQMVSPRLL